MDEDGVLGSTLALAVAAGCQAHEAMAPPRSRHAAESAPAPAPAPSAPPSPEPSPENIRHLLARLTFGAQPGMVEQVRTLGIERWLERELAWTGNDQGAETAVLPFRLALGSATEVATNFLGDARHDQSGFERLELGGKYIRVDIKSAIENAQMAQIARQISADNQLLEVMVEFWTNHFNVFVRKGKIKILAGNYVETAIRPHALGRFGDLLVATARHPAMLIYLDNVRSVRSRQDWDKKTGRKNRRGLNENYARELLELHTVGVDGGYTQSDVVEVARIFTGWSIDKAGPEQQLTFLFRPYDHDEGSKLVLGRRFPGSGGEAGIGEGLALLDFLAQHPSTARHLAFKLCQRFIADEPPESAVASVARAFQESGGDIKAMLRALVRSEAFWDERHRGAKLKTPSEFLAGMLRAIGASADTSTALLKARRTLGEAPLMQPSPTGYPDRAAAWSGASQLLSRMQLALSLTAGKLGGARLPSDPILPADVSPESLIERVNLIVFGGLAKRETLDVIADRIKALDSDHDRRIVALTLAFGSPEFQYQ